MCRFGALAAFVPGSYADEFKRKNLRKAAEAAGFTQEMQVQIGVFDAAEVKLDYEQKEGKYDISAEVRTANLFDALYPFTARYGSRGRVVRSAAEKGNGSDVAAELYQT